jgi:AcrR family transcriptional regulator
MARPVKPVSSLRAEHASQTRRKILAAAAVVFDEQGFAGARVEAVAERAGVAVPTVYKVFTNKVNLLVGALNQTLTGSDADDAIDDQVWFREQLEEPDPVRQLRLIARNARLMYERGGRLLDVLRAAAPLDDLLADAWERLAADRLARGRLTAKSLEAKARHRLRANRTQVASTLWALTDPQLFATYTANGHTPSQYETWLADVLTRTILD